MLQTGSDCGSGKVPARSFFIFATQSPTHSYMRLPRYSLKHIHQQKPFQVTNELAFSNDITGKPGVLCQFQRIYLTSGAESEI